MTKVTVAALQLAFSDDMADNVALVADHVTKAAARGDVRADVEDVHAWAIMGMNVFLGLRYGVWDDSRPAEEIAAIANALVERGIGRAG